MLFPRIFNFTVGILLPVDFEHFRCKPWIKKDLSLTAQKWQSAQESKKIKVQTLPDDPPSVKRSQSFQSTKSDEKDLRIKELEKQLAKAKGEFLLYRTLVKWSKTPLEWDEFRDIAVGSSTMWIPHRPIDFYTCLFELCHGNHWHRCFQVPTYVAQVEWLTVSLVRVPKLRIYNLNDVSA